MIIYISISKNMYIDKLADIINKYNNTYHSALKMKPVADLLIQIKRIIRKIQDHQILTWKTCKNIKI